MVGIAGLRRREVVLARRVEEIFLGNQHLREPIKSQRLTHSTCVSALNLDLVFGGTKDSEPPATERVHSPTLLSLVFLPSSIQLAPTQPEGEQAKGSALPDWPSVPAEGEGPTCPRASQGCRHSCSRKKILKCVFSWVPLIRFRYQESDF